MLSTTGDWATEPHPVDPALEPTYRAEPYNDPFLVPVLEKLNQADRDKLVALMGGWPIVPSDD